MQQDNIVTTFKAYARKNMKSVSAAVRQINEDCYVALTPSNLDQMEKGTRRIPESVFRFMMKRVVDVEVAKNHSPRKLANRLSPPLRVKE